MLISARALVEERPIVLEAAGIPEHPSYVMFDLEGMPPSSMRWRRSTSGACRCSANGPVSSAPPPPDSAVLRIFGNELRQANVGENAGAAAADGEVAPQRDNGNAHPEGIAGGGAAAIREGIKSDIDLVVQGKVGIHGNARHEGDALVRNPMCRQDAHQCLCALPAGH